MTAPAVQTRAIPGSTNTYNKMLRNGYQSKIACSLDPDISFWEKSITPPSMDNGEPIDITTMWNESYRTKAAQALSDSGMCTVRVAYDPDVYNQILAILAQDAQWTVEFPDGSTLSFYGYLKSFEVGELVNGTQPEGTITIVVTNYDQTAGAEEPPVVVPTVGT